MTEKQFLRPPLRWEPWRPGHDQLGPQPRRLQKLKKTKVGLSGRSSETCRNLAEASLKPHRKFSSDLGRSVFFLTAPEPGDDQHYRRMMQFAEPEEVDLRAAYYDAFNGFSEMLVPCTAIPNLPGGLPRTPQVVGSGVRRRVGRSSSDRACVVKSDDERPIRRRTLDPTTNV